jgi:hypothetical protein
MAVHLDPRSEVSEAYRTVRTAVYFGAGSGSRAKTLLVTSPEPGDGKTTSASNLAIAIAQTGRNILLLDADFRKPTQHKNLDVKDSVGLSSVLAGMETHVCVQQTALDLLAEGFRVYVAADAVSCRFPIDHEFALRRMAQAGAIVTTAEAAAFEWVGQSGTPEFKVLSKLVQERAKG